MASVVLLCSFANKVLLLFGSSSLGPSKSFYWAVASNSLVCGSLFFVSVILTLAVIQCMQIAVGLCFSLLLGSKILHRLVSSSGAGYRYFPWSYRRICYVALPFRKTI